MYVCLVIQLCLILCNPVDCSPLDFSVQTVLEGYNSYLHSCVMGKHEYKYLCSLSLSSMKMRDGVRTKANLNSC